jgi:hypothetical protein
MKAMRCSSCVFAVVLVAVQAEVEGRPSEALPEETKILIGPDGVVFSMKQRASAHVPGSRGRIEVLLGDITRGQVRLGVRTVEGALLANPRSVAAGDEVTFEIGGEGYSIRVERLVNLLIGDDRADLRVTRRDAGGAAAEKPVVSGRARAAHAELAESEKEIGRAESFLNADRADEARAALQAARRDQERARDELRPIETLRREEPVQAALIDLVRAKLASAGGEVARAGNLLDEGEAVEARAALRSARRLQEEARDGLRIIEDLPSRLRIYLSSPEDLSVIKVRILNARPSIPYPSFPQAPDDPRWRSYESVLRGAYRLLGAERYKIVGAEVLEVRTVGKRYAGRTLRGKQFPSRLREDLRRGDAMELNNDAPETGVEPLEEGRAYWIAITPPIASKGIPRAIGSFGRNRIVFAIPAED